MSDTYKIVVVSDNHGKREVLKKIRELHPDADYYFHCGDTEMNPEELVGWDYVRGNMDFDATFPLERVYEIGNHKVLVIHGNYYVWYMHRPDRLIQYAKGKGCDIVFYGHLHVYKDETFEGIRMLNPGSLRSNRDMSGASYMIATITDDGVTAVRMPEPK